MDEESGVEEKMSDLVREREERTPPEYQCSLCDSLHGSVDDKDDSPLIRAVLCSRVCKLYRLPTETDRWMLVKEQMSETPLTFHLPTMLLDNLIQEEKARIQELNDLCDLSPDWDGLRRDVISHCSQLIGWYKETLSELNRLKGSSSFKSSQRKADRHVQFVPTNLHLQRMEVIPDVCYDVITVGAPAEHHMSFKHGGLKRLLNKHTSQSPLCFSPGEGSRARALLASMAKLQPLIFGLSEEVLTSSLELSPTRLQQALDRLAYQTEQFVHALKDELVRSTLLAIHALSPAPSRGPTPVTMGNGVLSNHTSANQEGLPPGCTEYDEEDWDRTWANVTQSLNCLMLMMDRLLGREAPTQEVMSSPQPEAPGRYVCKKSYPGGSRQDQLLPLVVTLRECVREASQKARAAMSVVLLQEALASSHHHTPLLTHRRDAVFSQALVVLVCGVVLRVYESVNQPEVLLQFHTAGVLVQFEALLSTYGEEVGMLEDMEVGVSDLSRVAFCVTAATSDHPDHLLPTLRGTRGSLVVELRFPAETFGSLPQELQAGGLIRVHPVLFNIGINQNQSLAERFGDCSLQDRINQENCELLKSYYSTLRDTLLGGSDIEALLSSLQSSVGSRKRKNVEVLWLAASVCRRVHGVRVTSCKSAKDRTAMSVTLEQCVLLRDAHTLRHTHFHPTLDTMRRSHLSWGQMVACYARPWCSVPRVGPWVGAPAVGPQAPGCHLYPVIFLLVISHLLVLWLIISLLIALDYHEGCRMDNVQKNVGWRRYAFSRFQLLTFPKIYRPPAGTYSSHTNTDT